MKKTSKTLYIVIFILVFFLSSILWISVNKRNKIKDAEIKIETITSQNNNNDLETMIEQTNEISGDIEAEEPQSGIMIQGKTYESLSDFLERRDEGEMIELPYIEDSIYEMLNTEIQKIEFEGEFNKGDLSLYDSYKKIFRKMMNNEIPLLDTRTNTEIYWKDFAVNDYNDEKLSEYEDAEHEYYFFDMDEDGAPELVMRVRMMFWLYIRYDPEKDKCVLWYWNIDAWESCLGSRKISSSWDGRDVYFKQLDKEGKMEYKLWAFTTFWSIDETYRMVSFPRYADQRLEVSLTDEELKRQGMYTYVHNRWWFRVTEEQYQELFQNYHEIEQEYWRLKEVEYTYEELFE